MLEISTNEFRKKLIMAKGSNEINIILHRGLNLAVHKVVIVKIDQSRYHHLRQIKYLFTNE